MAEKENEKNTIHMGFAVAVIVVLLSLAFHFGFAEGLAAGKAYFN